MDWKLFDIEGNFIQEVNCQYDSLDIALFDNNAVRVEVNFQNKEAYILESGQEVKILLLLQDWLLTCYLN